MFALASCREARYEYLVNAKAMGLLRKQHMLLADLAASASGGADGRGDDDDSGGGGGAAAAAAAADDDKGRSVIGGWC